MAETLSARVTRLEELAKILLDAQVQTEARFQQTETRFQELREEANEREKRMDERILALVSAIGELIRNRDGKGSE